MRSPASGASNSERRSLVRNAQIRIRIASFHGVWWMGIGRARRVQDAGLRCRLNPSIIRYFISKYERGLKAGIVFSGEGPGTRRIDPRFNRRNKCNRPEYGVVA